MTRKAKVSHNLLPERCIKKDYTLSVRIEKDVVAKIRKDAGYGSCPADITRMILRSVALFSSKDVNPMELTRRILLGVK